MQTVKIIYFNYYFQIIYYNNCGILKFLTENEDIFESFFENCSQKLYDSIEFLYELNIVLKGIH